MWNFLCSILGIVGKEAYKSSFIEILSKRVKEKKISSKDWKHFIWLSWILENKITLS